MSKSIVTPVGRASFPNLSKPDQFNKYSISLLFSKTDPKVIEFVKWLKGAVNEEALATAGQAGLPAALAAFTNFKDGDNVAAFKTYRAEYTGHYILNVSRKTEFGKPCVVNRDKQPIDPTEVYAGCNVLAYIDVYGYKYGTKKSVSVGIQHIMKTGENTPFASAGVQVDDAFADLEIPEDSVTGAEATGPMPTGPQGPQGPQGAPGAAVKDPFAGV